jgi:putative transposase
MSSHRKTCHRYDVPGDTHLLTFSCFRRLPLLSRDRSREWLLDGVRLGQRKGQFHLWAFVVMPEHVHLVVRPLGPTKVSQILKTMKKSTTNRALSWLHAHAPTYLPNLLDAQPNGACSYRFRQRGGGHDRNLRSVRDIHEKIAYVHENPVRRGLVEHATAWRWSSALAWRTGQDEPLTIDRQSLSPLTLRDEPTYGPLMRNDFLAGP